MSKCKKCGCEIKGYPAISRLDGTTELCPHCGTREALEIIGMPESEIKNIMDKIDKIEKEAKVGNYSGHN